MGLFSKKGDDLKVGFAYGVQDSFQLKACDDLVVVGQLSGLVRVGDEVCITNYGDEKGEVFKTVVLGIEIGSDAAEEAMDGFVSLRLEHGQTFDIRTGTVVYADGQDRESIRDAYVKALGEYYISHAKMEIDPMDLEKMTLTDCQELWRMYAWYCAKNTGFDSEAGKVEYNDKTRILKNAMAKKLYELDEIYCLYNKRTGEPHMFSRIFEQKKGFLCTPPNILLVPKVYKDLYEEQYPADQFALVRVENGPKRTGIYNFIGTMVYLNGADGISILREETTLEPDLLVVKPDYSKMKDADIPVTNPELQKWLILLNQIGEPQDEDQKMMHRMYFSFMSQQLLKAKFVIPIKMDKAPKKFGENGRVEIEEGAKIEMPLLPGKNNDGREAVRIYTDWKQLRSVYGQEWDGMLETVEGMIDKYDCAINVNKQYVTGCYISKAMFDEMKAKLK